MSDEQRPKEWEAKHIVDAETGLAIPFERAMVCDVRPLDEETPTSLKDNHGNDWDVDVETAVPLFEFLMAMGEFLIKHTHDSIRKMLEGAENE